MMTATETRRDDDQRAARPAIAVDGVRKRYGRIEALKGVSLEVGRGEIFGLLGANGAGKSTLIKILVGSSRPSAGAVEVLGLDPTRQAGALRQQIGYMPQAPALYEDLSPRDNVRFFGQAHRLEHLEERIDEVLAFTNLRDRERDPVYGFSGGMKQRVSLACALVHRPRALFLDEPTAGIDPKLREAFWQHFRDLAAGGATLLVSTHLMTRRTSATGWRSCATASSSSATRRATSCGAAARSSASGTMGRSSARRSPTTRSNCRACCGATTSTRRSTRSRSRRTPSRRSCST